MKKTIPILLSAALLLSACGQAAGTAETTSADAPAAVTETTAQTSAPKTTPGGVDKAETVYAKCRLISSQSGVIESCPAGSNSGYCLPVRCAPHKKCCSWTSLFPGLIPK